MAETEVKKDVVRRPRQSKDPTPPKLELLVTVVPRAKAELYVSFISQFEVNAQYIMLGEGTANSQTIELLGLNDSERAVIFSVIREDKIKECLKYIEGKFHTVRNGNGIAFTSPMTSVIGVAVYQFLINNKSFMEGQK